FGFPFKCLFVAMSGNHSAWILTGFDSPRQSPFSIPHWMRRKTTYVVALVGARASYVVFLRIQWGIERFPRRRKDNSASTTRTVTVAWIAPNSMLRRPRFKP